MDNRRVKCRETRLFSSNLGALSSPSAGFSGAVLLDFMPDLFIIRQVVYDPIDGDAIGTYVLHSNLTKNNLATQISVFNLTVPLASTTEPQVQNLLTGISAFEVRPTSINNQCSFFINIINPSTGQEESIPDNTYLTSTIVIMIEFLKFEEDEEPQYSMPERRSLTLPVIPTSAPGQSKNKKSRPNI